jgi:hypothetical protein
MAEEKKPAPVKRTTGLTWDEWQAGRDAWLSGATREQEYEAILARRQQRTAETNLEAAKCQTEAADKAFEAQQRTAETNLEAARCQTEAADKVIEAQRKTAEMSLEAAKRQTKAADKAFKAQRKTAEAAQRLIEAFEAQQKLPTSTSPTSPTKVALARQLIAEIVPNGGKGLKTKEVWDKLCAEHANRGGAKDYFSYDTTERALRRNKRR